MQPGRRMLLDHETATLRRRNLALAARLRGLLEIPLLAVGGELSGRHDDPPVLTRSYHGPKAARNQNPQRPLGFRNRPARTTATRVRDPAARRAYSRRRRRKHPAFPHGSRVASACDHDRTRRCRVRRIPPQSSRRFAKRPSWSRDSETKSHISEKTEAKLRLVVDTSDNALTARYLAITELFCPSRGK